MAWRSVLMLFGSGVGGAVAFNSLGGLEEVKEFASVVTEKLIGEKSSVTALSDVAGNATAAAAATAAVGVAAVASDVSQRLSTKVSDKVPELVLSNSPSTLPMSTAVAAPVSALGRGVGRLQSAVMTGSDKATSSLSLINLLNPLPSGRSIYYSGGAVLCTAVWLYYKGWRWGDIAYVTKNSFNRAIENVLFSMTAFKTEVIKLIQQTSDEIKQEIVSSKVELKEDMRGMEGRLDGRIGSESLRLEALLGTAQTGIKSDIDDLKKHMSDGHATLEQQMYNVQHVIHGLEHKTGMLVDMVRNLASTSSGLPISSESDPNLKRVNSSICLSTHQHQQQQQQLSDLFATEEFARHIAMRTLRCKSLSAKDVQPDSI